ncbi:MAG: hypothetical protein ACOYL6_09390 [Bacteriovoracaceae bacterium]
MITEVQNCLDRILVEYTRGHHLESLIEAKKEYFELTGTLTEEDDEYESRMNAFNDWYLFQYLSKRKTKTVVKDFLEKSQIEDNIAKSLLSVNHSLFEFKKINFFKKVVLEDVLHGTNVILPKDGLTIGIVKGDMFTGRLLTYNNQHYLLKGVCIYPESVKNILRKESKKVRKLKDPGQEHNFLLKLEQLKTKSLRYGHIDMTKIFVFPTAPTA